MSRAPHHIKDPIPPSYDEPTPPIDGWTLMDAANVLCPREAEIYREGGEALEAAISTERHRLAARANDRSELRRDVWLSRRLLDELCKRPALKLTGRNALQGPMSPRIQVEPDVIRSACKLDYGDPAAFGEWVNLDFRHDHARVGYTFPKHFIDYPKITDLIQVRIEACGAAVVPPPASQTDQEVKSAFNVTRCRAWLRLMVDGWPKGVPFPSEVKCLALAKQEFAGSIPRNVFRTMFRDPALVPPELKKRGRRRRPN